MKRVEDGIISSERGGGQIPQKFLADNGGVWGTGAPANGIQQGAVRSRGRCPCLGKSTVPAPV